MLQFMFLHVIACKAHLWQLHVEVPGVEEQKECCGERDEGQKLTQPEMWTEN